MFDKIDLNKIDKVKKREKLISLVQNGKNSKAKSIFEDLHPADQAEMISSIDPEFRIKMVAIICNIELKFLIYLEDHIK